MGTFDITMVTQFTIQRVLIFEKLVQTWDGPLHAVFYGTDEEVAQFELFYRKSTVFNKVYNVAIHVVYSREVKYV